MREADKQEVFAAGGLTPLGALMLSYRRSRLRWTCLVDGKPEVMFGVGIVNVINGIGAPWLLGTDVIHEYSVTFLRETYKFRPQLFGDFLLLRNFVDVRNTAAIRWLQWLGFELKNKVEFNGHTFRMFEMRLDDV